MENGKWKMEKYCPLSIIHCPLSIPKMISVSNPELLEVAKRGEKKIKSKNALKEGRVLGVVYGTGIKENLSVIFPKNSFLRLLEKTGEGTLIKLKVEGEDSLKDVIIQDIQYHTYSEDVLHVDFLAVSLDEEVEVEVPVELVGVSPAVKDLGGILIQNVENLEVKCKAKDIPKAIEVDISILANFEDMIHLSEIKSLTNIEILGSPELVLAMIEEPRTEKEMEELEQTASADVTQVEGVKKEETETAEAKEVEKKD